MAKTKMFTSTGHSFEAEIISVFELKDFGKEYILYALDHDEKDNAEIMASTLVREDDKYILNNIATEEEWTKIKKIMKNLITNETY